MNISRSHLAALAGVLTLGVGVLTAAQAEEPFAPVRQRILKAIDERQVPSIAVAVVRDGKILWEQGFGWADRENQVPAYADTPYSVASTSKPVTATALMVLKERGQLELDHPANEYLGDVKLRAHVGDAAEATVRRVANHTAGLPLHWQFFYADGNLHPPSRDETIRRYGHLVTAPGETYQYSNLGYGILDYIIERKGGKKYADFMRDEVFVPLGMTHSAIGVPPGLESKQALRYTSSGERLPFYEFDHDGASAVYSSAHDLALFCMFHLKEHLPAQKPILQDATIDEMQQPTSKPGGERGYGIGWVTTDTSRGYRTVDHDGGMPGVSTMCLLVPSQRIAVVVLANTRNNLPRQLAEMILSILIPDKKDPTDEQLRGTWKGKLVTYQAEFPLQLRFTEENTALVKLGDGKEKLLEGATAKEGVLRGHFSGDINNEDARGRPYDLRLALKLRDGVLGGPVTAATTDSGRDTSGVTHWAELRLEPAEKKTPPATAPAPAAAAPAAPTPAAPAK